ncbi:MAG: nitroreductase family deazaflavin-dependent oxidoreductase [Dehalococcoidia bacterium]
MDARHLMKVRFTRLHARIWSLGKGRIGGTMRGGPVLLLKTTGRTSGKTRELPLIYIEDGENLVVVASNGGAPDHPSWFKNLVANPVANARTRAGERAVTARVASDAERDRLWPRLDAMYAGYSAYRAKTGREIPIVVLEPRP